MEQLSAREVEIIDIASISRDYWSKVISSPKIDLTAFKSQRTERGPLLKGWMVCNSYFSIIASFHGIIQKYGSVLYK